MHAQLNTSPLHKRGFSLVEAAIVLGVISLVIGGIWVATAAVSENQRVTLAAQQVSQIITNLRGLYKGVPIAAGVNYDFNSTNNQSMLSSVFPADMLAGGNKILNPWGMPSSATVYRPASGYGHIMDGNIIVVRTDIPDIAACTRLITLLSKDSTTIELGVIAGGDYFPDPKSPESIIQSCTDAFAEGYPNNISVWITLGL